MHLQVGAWASHSLFHPAVVYAAMTEVQLDEKKIPDTTLCEPSISRLLRICISSFSCTIAAWVYWFSLEGGAEISLSGALMYKVISLMLAALVLLHCGIAGLTSSIKSMFMDRCRTMQSGNLRDGWALCSRYDSFGLASGVAVTVFAWGFVFGNQDYEMNPVEHGRVNFVVLLAFGIGPWPLILGLSFLHASLPKYSRVPIALGLAGLAATCLAIFAARALYLWASGLSGRRVDFLSTANCNVRTAFPWIALSPIRLNYLFSAAECPADRNFYFTPEQSSDISYALRGTLPTQKFWLELEGVHRDAPMLQIKWLHPELESNTACDVRVTNLTGAVIHLRRVLSTEKSFRVRQYTDGMFLRVTCPGYHPQYKTLPPPRARVRRSPAHPPVIIIGFDSVSRAAAWRALPRTKNVIETVEARGDSLVFEFMKHHSTGFATQANMAALFGGSFKKGCGAFWNRTRGTIFWAYEVCGIRMEDSFDKAETINTRLRSDRHKENPLTDFFTGQRDHSSSSRFITLDAPFCEPDLWPQPDPLQVDRGPYSLGVHCLGDTSSIQLAFDTFDASAPSAVTIFWFMHGHEASGGVLPSVDKRLAAFLQSIDLTETVVLLAADHGNHAGPYRQTAAGWIEMSQPLTVLMLPHRVANLHGGVHGIRRNEQRLTTHYDMYATLSLIVNPKGGMGECIAPGRSLFDDVGDECTLEELGVENCCACEQCSLFVKSRCDVIGHERVCFSATQKGEVISRTPVARATGPLRCLYRTLRDPRPNRRAAGRG